MEATVNSISVLKAQIAAAKAEAKVREWETRTLERNPQLVAGSRRKASEADKAKLAHCHGDVCDIRCVECGTIRTVNTQDAFQVRYCLSHKAEAKKVASKEARVAKAADPAKVAAKIAALQAKLSAMGVLQQELGLDAEDAKAALA